MTKQYFHFTIGPVQGFVAQARRTRDFWAGSFLLSWLSAVAMLAVKKQNKDNKILFPLPDDNYLDYVEGKKTGDDSPRQGSIPNRFKAEIIDNNFAPKAVEKTVQIVWKHLAEHIWNNDLIDICSPEQKKIWNTQVENFWEIAWALTEDESESDILDRRKNLRSYMPPFQNGIKCMVMESWQELSGAERPGKDKDDVNGPDAFWKRIRESGKTGIKTDIREGEYLCAIAFIKRRFARHFGSLPSIKQNINFEVKGWNLSNGVPSVSYMAACKWIAKVIEFGDINILKDFLVEAVKLTDGQRADWGNYPEIDNDIKCVKDAINSLSHDNGILRKFASLDGNVFFETALENINLFKNEEQAKKVKNKLKAIIKKTKLDNPSPFYAILLMDGDSLGVHMSKEENQTPISEALNQFTKNASTIVKNYDGFLIYAGGDDVLAMLPMETALKCAQKLREEYRTAFESKVVKSTLSGAIEYAHIKMPLTKVLKDAHQLLDDIAKEGRGRDAIACRVWKPGGMAIEWAMPWEIAIENNEIVVEKIMKENFRENDEEASFSNKFFYKLRKHFDLSLETDQMLSLLAVDYLASGVNTTLPDDKKLNIKKAKKIIEPLLEQSTPVIRDVDNLDKSEWERRKSERSIDAALLIRFLASKGVE